MPSTLITLWCLDRPARPATLSILLTNGKLLSDGIRGHTSKLFLFVTKDNNGIPPAFAFALVFRWSVADSIFIELRSRESVWAYKE
jgi:hypothetical protein